MTKKRWIPILSVLVALIFLLSPIAPAQVQDFTAQYSGQSLGGIFHSSGNPWAHTFSDVKDIRTATVVVAAVDSEHEYDADYRCNGIDDHVQIQAALDALPTTGGEVRLLDGTYNCEVQIDLDSNQTLRGCGRNTILTTSTADLIFLSAIGGDGSELTGIVITDLQIDGDDVSDVGIYFEFVDYSFIQNAYSKGNGGSGIYFDNGDNNTITSNICQENGAAGIGLHTSSNNAITGNTCQGNAGGGIYLVVSSNNNTIAGNNCQGNGESIYLQTNCNNNIITGNTCQGDKQQNIYLSGCNNNIITGNTCFEGSQSTTNYYDAILLYNSDYNNVQGNTCRAGALVKVPKYGINISNAGCNGNLVTNNDIYDDGFGTGSFNDAGTATVTAAGNRT